MTGIEFLVCTGALASVVSKHSSNRTDDYHRAVAHNICAAANAESFDPVTLAALIMGENRRFDASITMPASMGVDQGLCQLNSVHQRARISGKNPYHPFDCTRIAADILKFYQARYNNSWMVISSYWNPQQTRQQTQDAIRYYNRWAANYRYIHTYFIQARNSLSPGHGLP